MSEPPRLRKRIVIVGTTGSGKTTLARRAAEIIGGKHIELDSLFHEHGWVQAQPEVFRERVRAAIEDQPRWVTCGGYRGHMREITWPLADQIVWIDLPFPVTFSRMFRRTLSRVARKEELWNGNRESLRNTFASRDSLLLFAIQYRNKYRDEYPAELSDPLLAHVDVVRLRRQCDVAEWLRGLEAEWRHFPASSDMTGAPIALPQRIAVIGASGSGKTTLARQIATAIGAPHIELDGLFHQANWVPADPEVFRADVAKAIAGPSWVTDGNYNNFVRDLIWRAADVLVWLDYPLPLVLWRLFVRTIRRGIKRDVLWNGNRESLRANFLSRQSLFLWAKKSHARHRRVWPAALAAPAMSHVRVARLHSPREADAWLRQFLAGGL